MVASRRNCKLCGFIPHHNLTRSNNTLIVDSVVCLLRLGQKQDGDSKVAFGGYTKGAGVHDMTRGVSGKW